jgi:hypothetical protein
MKLNGSIVYIRQRHRPTHAAAVTAVQPIIPIQNRLLRPCFFDAEPEGCQPIRLLRSTSQIVKTCAQP